MNLILKNLIYSNCSDVLAEAIVKRHSPLCLASQIEEIEAKNKSIILGLLELKANLFASKESIRQSDYKVYSDLELYNRIYFYFSYRDKDSQEYRLSDDNYVAIANTRYPNRFDRCLTITVNCDLGDNIIIKIDYKVVARKGLDITKYNQEVSFDEIIQLEDNNDIVVINIQNGYRLSKKLKDGAQVTAQVKISNFIRKLNRDKWLAYCDRETSSWQKFEIIYLKNMLTSEFIESCIKRYVDDCKRLFEIPDIEHIIKSIGMYKYNGIFDGLKSLDEKARFIKECAEANGILSEAEGILRMHSEPYQFIMSLCK